MLHLAARKRPAPRRHRRLHHRHHPHRPPPHPSLYPTQASALRCSHRQQEHLRLTPSRSWARLPFPFNTSSYRKFSITPLISHQRSLPFPPRLLYMRSYAESLLGGHDLKTITKPESREPNFVISKKDSLFLHGFPWPKQCPRVGYVQTPDRETTSVVAY